MKYKLTEGHSRRSFLGSLGPLVALPTVSLHQDAQKAPSSQDSLYSVMFEIRDRSDVEILGHHGNMKPRYIPVVGSAEYIRDEYQKMLQDGTIPDTSYASTMLENVAADLSRNPNFFAKTFNMWLDWAEAEGVIRHFHYSHKTDAPNGSARVGFSIRCFREGGLAKIIQLVSYECLAYGSGYRGWIAGDSTSEQYDGETEHNKNETERVVILRPADDKNTDALNEVDVNGLRRKILEGLRAQELRFTPDWKPIIPQ